MLRVYKRKPGDEMSVMTGLFGGASQRSGYRTLDRDVISDLLLMYHTTPVFKLARQHTASTTLSEPFTWSIKQLGITSTPDMGRIFEDRWLPWGVICQDWIHLFGVCPFRLEGKGGHQWPVSPDMRTGTVSVCSKSRTQQPEYYWDDHMGAHVGVEPDQKASPYIYWIVTEDSPGESGELRSNMYSLLSDWRTLRKQKNAIDIVGTQRARPIHIIEQKPQLRTAVNDNLMTFEADFGKAAGITQARQDFMAEQQLQMKQRQTTLDLRRQQQEYMNNNGIRPTLLTDTSSVLREEADTGLGSRVYLLRPDTTYREAAKPELVGDYSKMEMDFNVIAAALMGFSFETIAATGTNRGQSMEGVERFENQRMRKQTRFFEHVFRDIIVVVYRDVIDGHIGKAQLQKTDGSVLDVHPELDVVVELPSFIFTNEDELRAMREDGIITQETMGQRILRNNHIPLTNLVGLMYPDNKPKETSQSVPSSQKPKKKKTKEEPATITPTKKNKKNDDDQDE